MGEFQLKYKPYGERSILVEWPTKIDENILYDLINFKKSLYNHLFESTIQIKSAYNSLLITYDNTIDNINNEVSALKALYFAKKRLQKDKFKLWRIPVCYDDCFALDLDEISNQSNLSKKEIIRLHSGTIYTVYFIGFLPGFLYMGGLDSRLFFARKSTPRLQINKGAVAIGGGQTGIYPNDSPGGWNIIGRTPISLFDSNKEQPCFVKAGDKIQFAPIGLKEYQDISTLVGAGVYPLESEVIND